MLYFIIKLNFIELYSTGLGQQSIKQQSSPGPMQHSSKCEYHHKSAGNLFCLWNLNANVTHINFNRLALPSASSGNVFSSVTSESRNSARISSLPLVIKINKKNWLQTAVNGRYLWFPTEPVGNASFKLYGAQCWFATVLTWTQKQCWKGPEIPPESTPVFLKSN